MPTDLVYKLPGGFECDLAAIDGGWAMAAVSMEDVDDKYVSNMDADREFEAIKALMLPGATYDDWVRAYVELRPTLSLLESRAGKVETIHTATAEQFAGLAVVGDEDPAYVWSDLDDGRWSVRLHHRDETRVLDSGRKVLVDPSSVRDDAGTLWIAWVSRENEEDVIRVTNEGQTTSFEVPGRHPSLAATRNGLAICYERFVEGQSHVYFAGISVDSIGEPVRLSSRNPLNFTARCISGTRNRLLVTWESSPAWGFDTHVNQVRDIEVKSIDPDNGKVSNGPGTEATNGVIPIPFRAYNRANSRIHAGQNRLINMTPSNPQLLQTESGLVCTFRVVHPIYSRNYNDSLKWIVDGGFNSELHHRDAYLLRDAWTLCITEWDGNKWSEPRRVTESVDYDSQESGNEGFDHHQYGLSEIDGVTTVACHCFNNYLFPPRDHRVEVLSITHNLSKIHSGVKHYGGHQVRPTNPPADPPKLPAAPKDLNLIYGDLHVHTSHSSCQPALDGNPPDNLRHQRDVLGYKVISLSDHHRISSSDFRQRQDLLERELAGGCIPIYGLEWNKVPWQHINFFTYDKRAMKELRQILHNDIDLQLMFDKIAENLPDQVAAVRHYHSTKNDNHTYIYDPRIEFGMEILCGRGDRMATEEDMFGGPTSFPFPINFIEWRDAKLGMIGSSDHHMTVMGACFTGFWVSEMTGEAIIDAMRKRRTIACGNGKTALWIESNGVGMGQVGRGHSPVEIAVSVTSALPVERVSLWGDGKWMEHRTVEDGQTQLTFVDERAGPGQHYYMVRVQTHRLPEFPRGPIVSYSSPLWLNIE